MQDCCCDLKYTVKPINIHISESATKQKITTLERSLNAPAERAFVSITITHN